MVRSDLGGQSVVLSQARDVPFCLQHSVFRTQSVSVLALKQMAHSPWLILCILAGSGPSLGSSRKMTSKTGTALVNGDQSMVELTGLPHRTTSHVLAPCNLADKMP